MSYKFDDKNHVHLWDDKPLHGVTTVLSVISKPALIQWAANMACDYIQSKMPLESKFFTLTMKEMETWLQEARVAHRKKKEKAGDWGSELHEAIEAWIKEGVEPNFEETQKTAFYNFVEWTKENKVEFIESEKHVWSEKMWLGGICDLVFKMDGKKYIGDIKTSSGIYNEAFFQMAAYDLCLREMGEHQDTEGYIVINLKKDGKMDLKRADNMAINKDAFLHALGLYKIIKSIE